MSIGSGNPKNDVLARFREETSGLRGDDLLIKFDSFMSDSKNQGFIKSISSYIESSIKGLKFLGYTISNADCIVQMDFESVKDTGITISLNIDFESGNFYVSGGFYTDFGTWDEDYKEISSKVQKFRIHRVGIEMAKVYSELIKNKGNFKGRNESMEMSVFEGVRSPVRTSVYVKKGGNGDYEDYVMVSSVKGDTVEFFNPFRDSFTMTVKEFNKKYKKGTEEDFTVFEEVNCVKCVRINESIYPVVSEGGTKYLCVSENGDKFAIDKSEILYSLTESGELNEASAQLSVVNKGIDKEGLLLVVNGKDYHYTSSELTPKQLEDKYVGIAKHSVGKAYAWIKKNAKAKESYKKGSTSPGSSSGSAMTMTTFMEDIKNDSSTVVKELEKALGVKSKYDGSYNYPARVFGDPKGKEGGLILGTVPNAILLQYLVSNRGVVDTGRILASKSNGQIRTGKDTVVGKIEKYFKKSKKDASKVDMDKFDKEHPTAKSGMEFGFDSGDMNFMEMFGPDLNGNGWDLLPDGDLDCYVDGDKAICKRSWTGRYKNSTTVTCEFSTEYSRVGQNEYSADVKVSFGIELDNGKTKRFSYNKKYTGISKKDIESESVLKTISKDKKAIEDKVVAFCKGL